METLKRTPAPARPPDAEATKASASRSSRKPLVVIARSRMPSMPESNETSFGKSRRTSGSPPVSRTSCTPMPASRPTSRTISSKRSTSERSSQGSPSAGMQYWQRKLQRSVTDTRRSAIRRPWPSSRGSDTTISYPLCHHALILWTQRIAFHAMSEELTRSGEGLFSPARRGYDRDEVDAYVAQLQREIRELQSRDQTPDAAVRSALERVGEEVAA